MPYSVMLDAGHGGSDPGAVYNGRQEKDDTLRLTLAVGEILQNNGIDVEYTRTTDVYESPYEKAMEANNAGADFFVSYTAIPFLRTIRLWGWKALSTICRGLSTRWRRTSMNSLNPLDSWIWA